MTKQDITFKALNARFMTEKGTIDREYFCEAIEVYLSNTKTLHKNVYNGRRPEKSLVWEAFWSLTNILIEIEQENKKFTASSPQLKKWLNLYADGYDTLKPVIDSVKRAREEHAIFQAQNAITTKVVTA